MEKLKVGERVVCFEYIEAFPHFIAKPGLGRVTVVERGGVWVKWDALIPGCEEWGNEVYFDGTDDASPMSALVSLDQGVAGILAEIKRDYPTARTFGELHDLCDANEFYADALGEIPGPDGSPEWDAFVAAANEIADLIDAALKG